MLVYYNKTYQLKYFRNFRFCTQVQISIISEFFF
nr:MAG TPA: hypothetical protein [Caudoviricetes sp.]